MFEFLRRDDSEGRPWGVVSFNADLEIHRHLFLPFRFETCSLYSPFSSSDEIKSLETTASATRGTAAFNSLHEISTRRRLKFGVKVDETTVLLWMTPRGGRNFNRGESCWVLCEVWKSRERLVN